MEDWNTLHDASLIAVDLDWMSREVHVRLKTSVARVDVTVIRFSLLSCPREEPWGRSVSVNEMRVTDRARGGKRVEIEMQTGDVIAIEGDQVTSRSQPL